MHALLMKTKQRNKGLLVSGTTNIEFVAFKAIIFGSHIAALLNNQNICYKNRQSVSKSNRGTPMNIYGIWTDITYFR